MCKIQDQTKKRALAFLMRSSASQISPQKFATSALRTSLQENSHTRRGNFAVCCSCNLICICFSRPPPLSLACCFWLAEENFPSFFLILSLRGWLHIPIIFCLIIPDDRSGLVCTTRYIRINQVIQHNYRVCQSVSISCYYFVADVKTT